MTNLGTMSATFQARQRPFDRERPAPQPLGPVYEGRKLVGHYSLAWNNEGTRQVRVFIPSGDVE